MVVKVADASALIALLFNEPERLLMDERLNGAELAAPTLLPFEVANACWSKMRRHPARRDEWLAAFAKFVELAIELRDVDHGAVLRTAEETGLTVYDASYLWLARVLGAELVTLDAQLQAAALAAPRR